MTDRPDGVLAETWEGCATATWQARWQLPELLIYSTIESTNDAARERAEAGAPACAVVLTDHQTAGRGRRGRGWHADPGQALLLSMVYALHGESAPGAAPLRVGLAVARAVEAASGVQCSLKWPNDVLAGGRKIAGVLCEAGTTAGKGWLVAGVGLNVHQRPMDFPAGIRDHATSVAAAAGFAVDRAQLGGHLVAAMTTIADQVGHSLEPETLDQITRRNALAGRRITVNGSDVGCVEGIAPGGGLVVRSHDGSRRTLHTGTIQTLEPHRDAS